MCQVSRATPPYLSMCDVWSQKEKPTHSLNKRKLKSFTRCVFLFRFHAIAIDECQRFWHQTISTTICQHSQSKITAEKLDIITYYKCEKRVQGKNRKKLCQYCHSFRYLIFVLFEKSFSPDCQSAIQTWKCFVWNGNRADTMFHISLACDLHFFMWMAEANDSRETLWYCCFVLDERTMESHRSAY